MKPFIFIENGEFSWRKGLTALTALLFAVAVIGFLVKHNFDELPGSYQAIIGGVFVFYFGKRFLETLSLKK
jgi:uncharacterized membrane protein